MKRFSVPFYLIFLVVVAGVRILKFEGVSSEDSLVQRVSKPFLMSFHRKVTFMVHQFLPSPHSELLLGMTVGIDALSAVPRFSEQLRQSGTIHVVVVSGYNISLVFGIVTKLLGSKTKLKNMVMAQVVTFLYSVLSGFDPPVVRSWIMGSAAAWGRYFQKGTKAVHLLLVSGLIMLVINPNYLSSLSFQLSFLATLSLVLYTDFFSWLIGALLKQKGQLMEDLIATLAAQVLVWPLISYKFGTVSLISPLVNTLILWVVPLATVLGGALLIAVLVLGQIPVISWYLVYVLLDIFVGVVSFFSKVPFASIDFTLELRGIFFYYGFIFFLTVFLMSKSCQS